MHFMPFMQPFVYYLGLLGLPLAVLCAAYCRRAMKIGWLYRRDFRTVVSKEDSSSEYHKELVYAAFFCLVFLGIGLYCLKMLLGS
jgi:hypothetical protein